MLGFFDFLLEKDIFLKLFNLSVSASFLVLAVLFLRLLLKKAPKWSICLLWGLVGLRLVFPFSIESVFSLIPSAETVSPDIVYEAEPTIDSGIEMVDHIINPILIQTFAPSQETVTSINPMQVFLAIATVVWLIGMLAMIAYMLVGYIRLRLRLRTAVKWEDNVYQSESVSSPFIFGTVCPRIYLPFAMDETEMTHVLAHERAHLRRLDHLTKPFAYLILAVYWFNPLLWFSYVLLCRDIELACDEKVVREMDADAKKAYSMALLKCSMNQKTRLACPLAFGEVGVKERVQNVMHYKKPTFWIIMIAVIAVIVTAVCFLTNPKGKGAEFLFYRPVEIVGEEESFSVNENIPISLQKYYMMISTGSGFYEWNEYSSAWNSMVDGSVNDKMTKIRMHKGDMAALFSEEFVFDGDRYGGDYLTLDSLYIGTKTIYSFEHTNDDGEKWVNYLFYQKDGGLYWGSGLAEHGYIRALCQLEPMENPAYQNDFYMIGKVCGEDMKFSIQSRPLVNEISYIRMGDSIVFYKVSVDESRQTHIEFTEQKMTASQMKQKFADTFVFSGDINISSEKRLTSDELFEKNKKVYTFNFQDRHGQNWFNQIFVQENGDLYWGYGYAEDGLIRILYKLESMVINSHVGYYEAVENIGSYETFSWQPNIDDLPYYQINVNGLLLSQVRGDTSWTLLGHLSEMDIAAARETASRLLTTPFLFEDEAGGNSAIRNTILSGVSRMWTLTREENDTEWTYYFIQVNNGTMYFGQGHDGILRWFYRMERVAEYETYTKPQTYVVSATSYQDGLNIKASKITFDDQSVRLTVAFTNTSEETSYYLRDSSLFAFAEQGYYAPVSEYQDNCAPIYLGKDQTVFRDYIFDRSYMENNSYMLNLFLKVNHMDVTGVCGYIVFQYGDDESPLVSDVSAKALHSDIEVSVTNVAFDDRYIKINASFINRNREKEYYLTYTTIDQYVEEGNYETIILQYADEALGTCLSHDIVVSHEFTFERRNLENGKYKLNVFFDSDSYRNDSPHAQIIFELENFEK